MQQQSLKQIRGQLKALIEESVQEECQLKKRGLAFSADELVVAGRPPELIKVWGSLQFLPLGSPFCCPEPSCHLALFADRLEGLRDTIQRRLQLRQHVDLKFAGIGEIAHADVEFDDFRNGLPPSFEWRDVDRRDALGRTALMRAAIRGHAELVEDLLAAGANPNVKDAHGRTIVELVGGSNTWIDTILQQAISPHSR